MFDLPSARVYVDYRYLKKAYLNKTPPSAQTLPGKKVEGRQQKDVAALAKGQNVRSRSPSDDGYDEELDRLLNTVEAAHILRLSPYTLQNHRILGTGARYVKIGRACRYRLRDLLVFIESNVRSNTADDAGET